MKEKLKAISIAIIITGSLRCSWYGRFVIHKANSGAVRSRKYARSVFYTESQRFRFAAPTWEILG